MIKDSIFLPLKNEYEADFTLLTKGDKEKGLYVRQIDHFDAYQLDKEIPISDFKNPIHNLGQINMNETSYWKVQVPKLAEDQLFFDQIQ